MESRSTSPIDEQKEPQSPEVLLYEAMLEKVVEQSKTVISVLEAKNNDQGVALQMKDAQIQALSSEVTGLKNLVKSQHEKIERMSNRIDEACQLAGEIEESMAPSVKTEIKSSPNLRSCFSGFVSFCTPGVTKSASIEVAQPVSQEMGVIKAHSH